MHPFFFFFFYLQPPIRSLLYVSEHSTPNYGYKYVPVWSRPNELEGGTVSASGRTKRESPSFSPSPTLFVLTTNVTMLLYLLWR